MSSARPERSFSSSSTINTFSHSIKQTPRSTMPHEPARHAGSVKDIPHNYRCRSSDLGRSSPGVRLGAKARPARRPELEPRLQSSAQEKMGYYQLSIRAGFICDLDTDAQQLRPM